MQFIRRRIPGIRYRFRHVVQTIAGMFPGLHEARLKHHSREEIFGTAYVSRVWGSKESYSGTGSELAATETIRRELPLLLRKYQVKTFLDAPCGDWNWMRRVELPVEKYIGVDVVSSVVAANQAQFGSKQCSFAHCDITHEDLPNADLVLCRDCLVHLSNQDICSILNNFKRSGIEFLLTNTYPKTQKNVNQFSGLPWRRINLRLPPFNFPKPLEDYEDGGKIAPGRLCLWKLDEIDVGSL